MRPSVIEYQNLKPELNVRHDLRKRRRWGCGNCNHWGVLTFVSTRVDDMPIEFTYLCDNCIKIKLAEEKEEVI